MLSTIQAMVAPAVMISVCGLLLLSVTPKLGRAIDRLRQFSAEERALAQRSLTPFEVELRRSIERQLVLLHRRAIVLERISAVLFFAVLAFVLTSFALGLAVFLRRFGEHLALGLFAAGMCLVLGAVALAYLELRLARATVSVELDTLHVPKTDLG